MNFYADHILEHYHNPQYWGTLEKATHGSEVLNPTCGDTLRFTLCVENGSLKNIAWAGEGCAISLASASLLSAFVMSKKTDDILKMTPQDLLDILQLPLSPGRLKCGILSLEGLHKALNNPIT